MRTRLPVRSPSSRGKNRLLLAVACVGLATVSALPQVGAADDPAPLSDTIIPPPLPGMKSTVSNRLAWLETIWHQHLEWKLPKTVTVDVEAELGARDLLRFDAFHLEATERLYTVGMSNEVYAIAGMATCYLDYLHSGNPAYTSHWPQVKRALASWHYDTGDDRRIIGSATFEHRQLTTARRGIAKGRYIGAENALRELVHVYPKHREGLRLLAIVFTKQNEQAMATMCSIYASRLFPEDPRFAAAFVEAVARIGREEEALKRFATLHNSFPNEPLYLAGYSRLLTELDRSDQAIEPVAQWVKKEPRNPEAWMYYANALLKTGRLGYCKVALNKAIELDPKLPQPYEFHARISVAEEDLPKAIVWLKRLQIHLDAEAFNRLLTAPPFEDLPPIQQAFSE